MYVKKLKYQGGKMTVIVETVNGQEIETRTIRACQDKPRASFLEALDAVTQDVLKATGIRGKTYEDAFTVTGVTVDKDNVGRRGFKFRTATETPMGTQNAGLPRMTERLDDEIGPKVMGETAVANAEKLMAEALKYFNGDREVEQLDALAEATG